MIPFHLLLCALWSLSLDLLIWLWIPKSRFCLAYSCLSRGAIVLVCRGQSRPLCCRTIPQTIRWYCSSLLPAPDKLGSLGQHTKSNHLDRSDESRDLLQSTEQGVTVGLSFRHPKGLRAEVLDQLVSKFLVGQRCSGGSLGLWGSPCFSGLPDDQVGFSWSGHYVKMAVTFCPDLQFLHTNHPRTILTMKVLTYWRSKWLLLFRDQNLILPAASLPQISGFIWTRTCKQNKNKQTKTHLGLTVTDKRLGPAFTWQFQPGPRT